MIVSYLPSFSNGFSLYMIIAGVLILGVLSYFAYTRFFKKDSTEQYQNDESEQYTEPLMNQTENIDPPSETQEETPDVSENTQTEADLA